MAQKKNPSRAERAVSDVKKNTGSSSSKPKASTKKSGTSNLVTLKNKYTPDKVIDITEIFLNCGDLLITGLRNNK